MYSFRSDNLVSFVCWILKLASVMGILAFPPPLEDKQKTMITVNIFESKKNF